MFPLPQTGEVILGRGETSGLRLEDSEISRQHAKLVMTPGDVRLCDLNSQNGTYINGERLAGARSLASGDTIVLGNVTLTFHSGNRRNRSQTVVDVAQFRLRSDEEVERSRRSQRPWAVAVIHLGLGVADRARVGGTLAAQLRRIDMAAWDGAERLMVLLAETNPEQALAAVARLLASLATIAPKAKAGIASFPRDGLDFDTLLASARAAALSAQSSQPSQAAQTFRTLQVGNREVLVADPAMLRVFDLVQRVAATEMTVLIHGETGCGKDIVASALHAWSNRRERPLVALNSAAIPDQLIESELFGYERGAFSGATTTKTGLIEAADQGTLFLDEIGELPLPAQAKLLRVLETKRLRPVGDVHERDVDIRVIAATNRKLEEEVTAGRFRADLFFRLKGANVWIPPLRDRKAELPILVQYFLNQSCVRAGKPPMVISPAAMEALLLHPWPGNVRELQNVMEYVVTMAVGSVVEMWHLADWIGSDAPAYAAPQRIADDVRALVEPAPAEAGEAPSFRSVREEIRELERSRIIAALNATGGNQTRAAELIGMPLRTFIGKLKTYGI
jgi:DNA-binding NtrC family response regulator